MADALRDTYGDKLIVLAVKRNAGSFTYDGIERGGERVAKEIEDTLEELARDGYKITKLSMVGYSLGGLVARYAIGLLHSRGWFKKLQPINFTTFATPHLGVRTPLKGYANHVWNVLGARTLSMSGRQIFLIDEFRDTGRPLLSVLADSDSIFIQALAAFEKRCLYSNIVNDRSAVYYTTSISRSDPYSCIDKLKINFIEGYDPVVLDPDRPAEPLQDEELPSSYERIYGRGQTIFSRLPIYLALVFFIPLGTIVFVVNSAVQTARSKKRIRLHEDDESLGFRTYRVPLMVQGVRQVVEDAFENVNAAQRQDYLSLGTEELAEIDSNASQNQIGVTANGFDKNVESVPSEKSLRDSDVSSETAKLRSPDFPTLALSNEQFMMIKALDDVGFRKYRVWIHKSRHSHAAIIVRDDRGSFDEGKVVVKHWLQEEFQA